MASIEGGDVIRPLTLADLPGAMALSAAAGWNQIEADWQTMLSMGQGFGLHAPDVGGRMQLAASAVTLPYGDNFAWTSMVLVAPAFRRRGYATRLLRRALDHIAAEGRAALLDATPAGRPVYLPLGFRDTWGFTRYRRPDTTAAKSMPSRTRALHDADWSAIAALDRVAFGADRLALLQQLAARQAGPARVVEAEGRLRGFVLARDGRTASQIGPLLADDAGTAIDLLDAALGQIAGEICLDLLDSRADAMSGWLQANHFAVERPFMRMALGRSTAPGSTGRLWLVAGPELG